MKRLRFISIFLPDAKVLPGVSSHDLAWIEDKPPVILQAILVVPNLLTAGTVVLPPHAAQRRRRS
jgi:hypothetical protein